MKKFERAKVDASSFWSKSQASFKRLISARARGGERDQ